MSLLNHLRLLSIRLSTGSVPTVGWMRDFGKALCGDVEVSTGAGF